MQSSNGQTDRASESITRALSENIMEVEFKNLNNSDIQWPKNCAICGGTAKNTATATSARGTGFYFFFWTENTIQLRFPVCFKHKFLATALDIPGQLGFVKGVIFYLFSPMLALPFLILIGYWTSKSGAEMAPISNIAIWISYFATATFYFYARAKRPIAIKKADDESIVLEVKNAEFANELSLVNRNAGLTR